MKWAMLLISAVFAYAAWAEEDAGKAAFLKIKQAVITAGAQKAEATFYVDFLGTTARARFVTADDNEVTVEVMGQEVKTAWGDFSPKRLYGMGKALAGNTGAFRMTLAEYCAANGMAAEADAELDEALKLDPSLKEKVERLRIKLHPELAPKPVVEKPAAEKTPEARPPQPASLPPLPAGKCAEKVAGWEPTGLSGGGAMFVPVISRANPDVMMINCDMSGCYVSRDAGRFWKMVQYHQRQSNTRCRPALHPTDANVILAPAGYGGSALKITRDLGETWEDYGNVGAPVMGEIIYDPDNPNLLIAGTTGGAAVSKDGGKGWNACKGLSGDGLAFHFDRTSPLDRRTIFAATKNGIWRSDDAGVTWTEKTSGLPWKQLHSFCGASDPNSKIIMLYCSVESRVQDGKFAGGIYRSRNRGDTWEWAMGRGANMETRQTGGYADGPIAQYKHVLAADPNPMRVYAFNTSTNFWPPGHPSCYRSDDAGDTWKAVWYQDPRFPGFNCEHNYHTASTGQAYQGCPDNVAICPSDPNRLLTVDGRVFLTYDGGATWPTGHCRLAEGQKPQPGCSWVCNGLVVTTTWHYYVDPHQHNRHYIAYTDIGFARSVDSGRTWIWFESGKWPPWRNTCYELAFDPEIPGKVWGAFTEVHDIPNGNIIHNRHWAGNPERGSGGVCLSTDFCESWKNQTEGLPAAPVCSVVVDPKSPRGSRTLYAGVFGKGVFKSTDDGKTWVNKSSGLGHPSNMRVYRVILHKDGTLFALITARLAGSYQPAGVGLYRSRDAGDNWELITKDPVLLWPKDFAVHPENSSIIFVGAADAGSQQGGLYRTQDGGARWSRVARFGNEHFGAYFHPKDPNWVYATMCEGSPRQASLWLSTDCGNTWKPFESFPFSNTMRVTVDPDNPDVIYVSTFGGSVFKGPAVPK